MFDDFIEFFLPIILTLVIIIGLIVGLVSIVSYFSSCKEAEIYNKINNATYTCSDFFWAGEQINQGVQTIKLK